MVRTKLIKLAEGVYMTKPCNRIRLIYDNANHEDQKVILYVGFDTYEMAEKCYNYLIKENLCYRYKRANDTGICKPRKAERVEECAFEIKIHRPSQVVVDKFIEKALNQQSKSVASKLLTHS
jgi:hypothetical protein